ncbi:12716_t:CDS:10 [Funneliformis caledonium]|uniref:12716_t:CDS:1 n=1 Tax=Funneliformis caledonium TaxID=1117310 RepID=A0A9N9FXU5_9GLOM|nr:12716_t:CDS:10 [Funneliformis caledonium]
MGSEERPRNQEELPFINNVNTVVSPASPRARHSVGSNRSFTNAMHNALHFTTITKSPNYGFGRSFLSTQNNFESGHPSYSASPSIIRNQTLALGNLNSLPESDKKEGSPPKDPNVAGQSNLSLLLQRESKTPSPPELATKSSNSPPSIAAAIAQIGQTQNNKNNHNVDKIHSESDGNFETIENIQDESRPLLHHQFGIPSNYGIEGEIGDDVISIEDDPWAEKSWIGTWLPCVGDDYLPNYEGEERPQQKFQFNAETIFREVILNPISYIPAVILGLLLNLLDAISYGMITFPISNPIFREFGPDGISMFFVSCIVSQVIYSGGFSIFGGGNGSMMIEVVPFLHIMAEIIIREANDPSEIIPTTILSFALSSVLTGVVFLLMGAFKLGSLIEFFPRHILVGCIGGVGWFLIATAIEVSAHLDENLLRLFDDFHTFALWGSALGLALLLRIIHTKCQHALVVPFYFMIVPLFFYLTVYLFELKWDDLRSDGWVFPMPEGDAPWYRFYSYYDFKKTNWGALIQTVPAMFALTFFGILHVPINIPALGVSLNEDNVNTNRELVAHGLSNMLSGFVGSVQNYLVYTNSVLFIKSGGDSRVAGLMLAAATAIVLFIGPWVVGYIPVMIVGALIFHLGLELMKEALIDTWGIVNHLEYLTIVAIVIAMGVLGFIEGIFLGIVMACIFFVVSNSRKNAIRSTFSGSSIKSTVRRRYRQQKFLKQVGNQIYVIKLHGYMFFGTINGVENAIRQVLNHRQWKKNPIRFLIVDFFLVNGMDFSAAEAFIRIQRLLSLKNVYLVLCGATFNSEVGKALRCNGIWGDTSNEYLQIFENFNEALEWCENMLLKAYYGKSIAAPLKANQIAGALPQPKNLTPPKDIYQIHSPRQHLVQTVGNLTLKEEKQARSVNKLTAVLMEAFEEISQKDVEFFDRLGPYFREINVPSGAILWRQDSVPDCLYLVEKGILKATWRAMESDQSRPVESILPGTMAGELGFFTGRSRDATLVAENDCVLWQMTKSDYENLLQKEPTIANEFMRIALNFSAERLSTITYYAFHLI